MFKIALTTTGPYRWCSPCRVLAPILEQVAKDAGVLLVKVNVDEAQTAAQKYKVMVL